MAKASFKSPEGSPPSRIINLLVCGDADPDLQDRFLENYGKKSVLGCISVWIISIPTNIGRVLILVKRGSSLLPDNFDAVLSFVREHGSPRTMQSNNFVTIRLHWLEGDFGPVSHWGHGESCNLWHPFDPTRNDTRRIAPFIQVIRLVTGNPYVSLETTSPGILSSEKKPPISPVIPAPTATRIVRNTPKAPPMISSPDILSPKACPSEEEVSSLALEQGLRAISRIFEAQRALITKDGGIFDKQNRLDALFNQEIAEIHKLYLEHVRITTYVRHALMKDAGDCSLSLSRLERVFDKTHPDPGECNHEKSA